MTSHFSRSNASATAPLGAGGFGPPGANTTNKANSDVGGMNKAPGAVVFAFDTKSSRTAPKSSLQNSKLHVSNLGKAVSGSQAPSAAAGSAPGGMAKVNVLTAPPGASSSFSPSLEALSRPYVPPSQPFTNGVPPSHNAPPLPPFAAPQQVMNVQSRLAAPAPTLPPPVHPLPPSMPPPPPPITSAASSSTIAPTTPRPPEAPQMRFGRPSYGLKTLDSFSLQTEISEGSYGVVYKAIDKETGKMVALKMVKIDPMKEKDVGFPVSAVREIRSLAHLQHEHVIQLLDVIPDSTGSTLYLVLDFVEHDLHQLLRKHRNADVQFSISHVKSFIQQLLTAIAFLHSHNFMHRDIKSSNLLVSSDGKLYLADFGLTKEYKPHHTRTPTVVTIGYRAPELVFQAPDYSIAVDMWSVGLILAELLTGKELTRGVKTELELITRLVEIFGSPNESNYGKGYSQLQIAREDSSIALKPQPENRLRSYFPDLSRQGFDLLSRMLCYNPDTRITATQALAHPWFKEYPGPVMPQLTAEGLIKTQQNVPASTVSSFSSGSGALPHDPSKAPYPTGPVTPPQPLPPLLRPTAPHQGPGHRMTGPNDFVPVTSYSMNTDQPRHPQYNSRQQYNDQDAPRWSERPTHQQQQDWQKAPPDWNRFSAEARYDPHAPYTAPYEGQSHQQRQHQQPPYGQHHHRDGYRTNQPSPYRQNEPPPRF